LRDLKRVRVTLIRVLRTSTPSRLARSILLAAACAACTVIAALPQTASAVDSSGLPGYVHEMVLNSSKSDKAMEFLGSVLLVEGDAVNSAKTEYRWGGTSCSGYAPTEAQLNFLFEVLRSGRALQIIPGYKLSGGTRCLVAYKIRPRPASGA